jgi:histidinol-phosphate aminotransferase
MPAYRPGRRPAPGQDLARLASNETPYPLLPSVVAAVTAALADSNRYPDPGATVLTEAIAAKHGLDPSRVAVGCGSVQLVQELVEISCDAGDEVVFGWRSFEAYPTLTAVAGATGVPVPLRDGHLDLASMPRPSPTRPGCCCCAAPTTRPGRRWPPST